MSENLGNLTLVPTPIDSRSMLEPSTFGRLQTACKNETSIFAVEESREGRRRWLRFGLPREKIEKFVEYNEQNWEEASLRLIQELKEGKNVYLMSDAGLPAFCDPGRALVDRCHREKIRVTSTAFSNSIALAVALSGFRSDEFLFRGFLPREKEERRNSLEKALIDGRMLVLMDTPYRASLLDREIRDAFGRLNQKNREIFWAFDLNEKDEYLIRGRINEIALPEGKRRFVLVLAPVG